MYLGKALQVTISGDDKKSLKEAADSYCKENGFLYCSNIYREFHLFQWKWEYKVDLYKPIDFKIEKIS